MQEVFAISSLADGGSCLLIDFPAIQNFTGCIAFLHRAYCGIAAIAHDVENVLMFFGNRVANEKGPRDVVVYRVRDTSLGPHVDQQKIAFLHRKVVVEMRSVVRIGAVFVDSDDRRMSRGKIAAFEFVNDELLDFNFRRLNIARESGGEPLGRLRRRSHAYFLPHTCGFRAVHPTTPLRISGPDRPK